MYALGFERDLHYSYKPETELLSLLHINNYRL